MLFDTAFNTVFDSIVGFTEEVGYKFSGVDVTLLVSGHADDIGIFTEWNHQNQFILDKIDEWLAWSGSMAAKPRKCRSPALHYGRPFDLFKSSFVLPRTGGWGVRRWYHSSRSDSYSNAIY